MKTLPFRMALHKGPSVDPYLEWANERIRAAVQKLIDDGIIDEQGNRIGTDLPEDMREGSEREYPFHL